MRLFGRRRRPLSESPSCHDSTLACSVTSITELFRLESVGPSHKAVGRAIRQRDIHLSDPSKKSMSSKKWCLYQILPGNPLIMRMYQIFLEPKIFIFLSIILEIDLDIQTVVPRL